MATPTFWNVPYQQNPYFTGREDVLCQLHRALHAESTVALSHPQGISGLGGIGKTQTALEYAYRYSGNYDAVFWVQADSAVAMNSGYVALAHLLGLPERDEQDQRIIVEAVLRWLRMHTGWLLVFDSMDDLAVVEPFLPKTGSGHILFTTRASALSGIAQRLEVQKMEKDDGALLVLRRSSLLPLGAMLQKAQSYDRIVACQISEELDGLPLALNQAGAYIKETPCTLADYLKLYRARRREVLETRGSFDQNYLASVATTWSLSFEKVNQANPAAGELLDFCAHLSPDAIPEEMVTGGAQYLTASLQKVVTHPLQFDQVLEVLRNYSLVGRNENATLNVHRLVQAVLQDAMPIEGKKQWRERAVRVVDHAIPHSQIEFSNWSLCEQYLPHAVLMATWIEQEHMTIPEGGRLLHQMGVYLKERARYKEAELLLVQAHTIFQQQPGFHIADSLISLGELYRVLGKYTQAEVLYLQALDIEAMLDESERALGIKLWNNLGLLYQAQGRYKQAEPLLLQALTLQEQQPEAEVETARSLNNLALLYQAQGKYNKAEALLQRALAMREQNLGSEHPDTADSLHNLANLYQIQGKYKEAEALLQRALAVREQLLGVEHPDTADTLNNLANLYQIQGKYKEAEALLQRALAIKEQQFGPEHPDTLGFLGNLAGFYHRQGNYELALELSQRILAVNEEQLGAEHPSMARSLNNLGELYRTQDNYSQAEPLLQRALAICEQQLGLEHPDIAGILNNLALLYYAQDKYSEAELLLQRARAIKELVVPKHPDTVQILNNLAVVYHAQGRYKEEESLLQCILSLREGQLGSEHPDTVRSLNNLAVFSHAQGNSSQAEPLFLRVLSLREQLLGPEHPDTVQSLNNLVVVYREQGKYKEAEPLLQRILSLREQLLGPEHPDTVQSLNHLAVVYREQEKYKEAEPLLQRILSLREQLLGPEHPDTVQSLNHLAVVYYEQNEYSKAEPLLQRVLTIREEQLGPEHPDTVQSLNNLAVLSHAQGNSSQAEPLFLHVLSLREQLLGPEHPDVVASLDNLATVYKDQEMHEQAEQFYERASAIKVRQLDIEKPGIAAILWNMMHFHQARIKPQPILTITTPVSDFGSATYFSDLALQLFKEERDEVAELFFGEALSIQEEQLGPQHHDTVQSLNLLAGVYYTQKKYALAESLLERVLTIQEQQEGIKSFAALLTRNNLAQLYKVMGKDGQDEQLLKKMQLLLDEPPEQALASTPSLERGADLPTESARLLRTGRRRTRSSRHRRGRASSRKRTRSSLRGQHMTESRVDSPETALPAPIWNVPYQRDLCFTGRNEILAQISMSLQAGQIIALTGTGTDKESRGIGKTSIAVEYAYQHRQDYQAILWTRADSRTALVSGFVALAKLLKLPDKDMQDQTLIVRALQRWLTAQSGWLLILDDGEDLSLIREFLPVPPSGHVLLTTRTQTFKGWATCLEVDAMEQDRGALLLLRRAGLVTGNAGLETASLSEKLLAREIVTELAGLPLALTQAAAFIKETHSSLELYLQWYHQQQAMLRERTGQETTAPIMITCTLSSQQILQQNLLAADLLELATFADHYAIPESLLVGVALFSPRFWYRGTLRTRKRGWLATLLSFFQEPQFIKRDEMFLLLANAIAILQSYALLERNSDGQVLSMHHLVQTILQDEMKEKVRLDWTMSVLQVLDAAFPKSETGEWDQCERYLPHLLKCAELVKQHHLLELEAASVIFNGGLYLSARAQYSTATPLYEHALLLRKQLLGEAHQETITCLNNLALLYSDQEQYERAEELLLENLAICEQQLPPGHLSTALCLSNLASFYFKRRKYAQAEPLCQRALEIGEQRLGLTHLGMATLLNNLAGIYDAQGKYEQAEQLSISAFAIREQQLKSDDPDFILSLHNLAKIYYRQEKYEQSERLYQRALALSEQQLGPMHPSTAATLNNLAVLYTHQDKYEQAEPLYQQALALRELHLGSEHHEVALSLNGLAILYALQRRYEQAEPLYRRALAICRVQLEPDHPDRLAIESDYTSFLRDMVRVDRLE